MGFTREVIMRQGTSGTVRNSLLVLAVVFSTAKGQGPGFRLMPLRTAPLGSPVGTVGDPLTPLFNADLGCWEVVTPPGVEIDLDIQGFGWGEAEGNPTLGAIQATLDSNSLNNGVGAALNPKGWPDSPFDGAYQATSICGGTGGDGAPCVPPFDANCGGIADAFCIANPDWIMPPCANDVHIIAVSTLSYGWATAAFDSLCTIDDGQIKTMGGLILEVPPDASGTYAIQLSADTNDTFIRDGNAFPIEDFTLTAACITIPCQSDPDCEDANACTTDTCTIATGRCEYAAVPAGTTCGEPSASECDLPDTCDGNGICRDNHEPPGTACADDGNECTSDVCDAGVCTHPSLSEGTPCGDPMSTECDLHDICDGDGVCQPNFVQAGEPCGDPSSDECTQPDTCDGSGACQENHAPSETPCTDDGDICTTDHCDSGICVHDPVVGDTDCNENGIADQCDIESGVRPDCDDNGVPDECQISADQTVDCAIIEGPCFEGPFFCTSDCDPDLNGNGLIDVCDCPPGTACGDPSDSECDLPDTCDENGVCQPNHEPDGLSCTDDGNECTDDVCEAGVCAHTDLTAGAPCGDSASTECDQRDTCNGAGTCQPNYQPAETACGDATASDCTQPDTCDGNGLCAPHHAPAGASCGDPSMSECDLPDTCDSSGTCLSNYVPADTACGDPTVSECDGPDTCDGIGVCQNNHESIETACTSDGDICTADHCEGGVCVHDPVTGESDCNENGIADECEVESGVRPDCDDNGVPDECQISTDSTAPGGPFFCTADCDADCNDTGVPDACELTDNDCNGNGVPDECDIASPTSDDCDGNGLPDECDLVDFDCNQNGEVDACDISAATSADCDGDGMPDECQIDVGSTAPGGPFFCTGGCDEDCNDTGIPDACELTGNDCNADGRPDECGVIDTCLFDFVTDPAPLNTSAYSDTALDDVPHVATDGHGNWVAVWQSQNDFNGTIGDDFDILVARSGDDAMTWSAPAVLNSNAASDNERDNVPRLTTDGLGTWVVVWASRENLHDTIGDDYDILFARSTDNGSSWSAAAPLGTNATSDQGDDRGCQITTDRRGNWLSVWYSSDDLDGTIGDDFDILFSRSTNGGVTWTAPAPLNASAPGRAGVDRYPQVKTDGKGVWLTVWESTENVDGTIGTDSDILFARSLDAGVSWSDATPLNSNATSDEASDFSPQLAADGRGNWVVLWASRTGVTFEVLYAHSFDDGMTWSPPESLGTSPTPISDSIIYPGLTSDGRGTWVATWTSQADLGGTIGSDLDILFAYSSDTGVTWSTPQPVNTSATSDGHDDMFSQITSDGHGEWLAAWTSAYSLGGTIGSDLDIVFSRLQSIDTDCNCNGAADTCDIANDTSNDCNEDGVPDECRIATNQVVDCTGFVGPCYGGPFFCESDCDPDANANGIIDVCDCPAGTVEWLDPPTDIIDARQPHPVNATEPLQGFHEFVVNAPIGAEKLDCWSLCESDTVDNSPNGVTSVVDQGEGTYLVTLDRAITPGATTEISFVDFDDQVSVGQFSALPGDTSGNALVVAPDDIRTLIDCLNGVVDPPCEIWRTDINRSGASNAQDILTLIDLLNGAGEFDVWLSQSVPSGCP